MISQFHIDDYSSYSLKDIYNILSRAIPKLEAGDRFYFQIANPNLGISKYAGELIDGGLVYRSWRSWSDLATLLGCHLIIESLDYAPNRALIAFEKFKDSSFHTQDISDETEKYGVDSEFFRINKSEEPSFYIYYLEALKRVNIDERKKILGLGINRGDEFRIIADLCWYNLDEISFTGIEHSKSAIKEAKNRLSDLNFNAIEADISNLSEIELDKFDMLVSIGTLQSPSINLKTTIMYIVQELLEQECSILLGFPNCRWIDGEMVYGAKAKNYSFSELSLVIKDIHWVKKYLQQHKFRVMITGREYIFLSAIRK